MDLTTAHNTAGRVALLLMLVCISCAVGCDDDGTESSGDASVADRDARVATELDASVDGGDAEPDMIAVTSAALVSLPTCDAVDDAVRGAAKRALRKLMADKRDEVLDALAEGSCRVGGHYWADAGVVYAAFDEGAGGTGPSAVSETNNQVAGVDEADFVKNDDGYIYVLADNALQIIDAWPAAQAHVVSNTRLAHTPKRMFVAADRALVFMAKTPDKQTEEPYADWWYDRGECTYGYDCDFTGDGKATLLAIYDVSQRQAPKLLRTVELSGSYISARRIGTSVHVIVYDEPELLRTLRLTPEEIVDNGACTGTRDSGAAAPAEGDAARVKALFAKLQETNLKAIDAADLSQLMGYVTDRIEGAKPKQRDACTGFYDSPLSDGQSLLSLVSLDLVDTRPAQMSTIISRAGASYASADSYYVAVRQQPSGGYWYGDLEEVDEASTVHKFSISDQGNVYLASGVVKGRVLNQFSMDELDGHLRIATTTGHLPSPEVHSTLSILQQDDAALVLRGQVDDIAPTEDIRSVRFVGERGYMVTFKKTDPLFVFDLADPTEPKILAELKIPGFSTYMHPLDDGHLLTIGYEASDQGDFAYYQGLQLQVFDVTDPAAPKLAFKETIGTRGSSSEAATNHLAFSYFAPRETLAVPVTICEGSSGTSNDYGSMTFSGLRLYHVTSDTDFSLTGEVEHPYVDPYDGSGTYGIGAACSGWWTSATSIVKRTVFMDDFVYSISERRVKVNDLRDLSNDLADVPLVKE